MTACTIAMGTFDGATYLPQQLASIKGQTHLDWQLWASDDGSRDETLAILEAFQTSCSKGQVTLQEGPRKGAAMNFLSLLHHSDLPDQPVALADQDDVWLPQKLAHILPLIEGPDPVLYAGRTIVADAALGNQRPSKPLTPAPSFQNALIQNRAAGNTIVLNQAALRALRKIGQPTQIAHHDWWLYQIMSGIGAKVIFDETPLVIYRQHGTNVFGANEGALQSLRRFGQLIGPEWRGWAKVQHAALAELQQALTPQNKAMFQAWMTAPKFGLHRAKMFRDLGLHRHKTWQTKLLTVLAGFGWI